MKSLPKTLVSRATTATAIALTAAALLASPAAQAQERPSLPAAGFLSPPFFSSSCAPLTSRASLATQSARRATVSTGRSQRASAARR